ncbi:hypothetical protein CR513_55249, partial [Mucuna pruriens]
MTKSIHTRQVNTPFLVSSFCFFRPYPILSLVESTRIKSCVEALKKGSKTRDPKGKKRKDEGKSKWNVQLEIGKTNGGSLIYPSLKGRMLLDR